MMSSEWVLVLRLLAEQGFEIEDENRDEGRIVVRVPDTKRD